MSRIKFAGIGIDHVVCLHQPIPEVYEIGRGIAFRFKGAIHSMGQSEQIHL